MLQIENRITLRRSLIAIGLFALAFACLAQIRVWRFLTSDQIYIPIVFSMGWMAVALMLGALATPKWGLLGFLTGWVSGLCLAPLWMVLAIMVV